MGLNNHIVNINFHLFVDHVMEEGSHGSLICCPCILEFKGHDFVIEYAPRGHESRLSTVFHGHLDLVVAQEAIHKGHHFVTDSTVDEHINVG